MWTMYQCDVMSGAEGLTRSASIHRLELDYEQARWAAVFIQSITNALVREF